MMRFVSALGVTCLLAASALAGDDAMDKARAMLHHHHGGSAFFSMMAERFEVQSGAGDPSLVWDAEASYGTDEQKLKLKTEGAFDLHLGKADEAELQFLLTQPIGAFLDLEYGLKQIWGEGPALSHAVIGLAGLLPHFIETDVSAALSDDLDLIASLEFEYELLLTQRLILTPRAELSFAAQDVPGRALGAGLSHAELGARLRYDLMREIAPYVGIEWHRAVGRTSALVQSEGGRKRTVSVLIGIRLWY